MPNPSAPDPADSPVALAEALLSLSREIAAAKPGNPGQLSQLVLRRGEILARLGGLDFAALDTGARETIQHAVDESVALDADIAAGFDAMARQIDKRLRQTRQSRQMVGRYQSPGDDPKEDGQNA